MLGVLPWFLVFLDGFVVFGNGVWVWCLCKVGFGCGLILVCFLVFVSCWFPLIVLFSLVVTLLGLFVCVGCFVC